MRQNVTANLGDSKDSLNGNEIKVDVNDTTDEEKEMQDKVTDAVENNKELEEDQEATVSDSDAENTEEEDDQDSVQSDEDYDDGYVDVEDEEEKEEKKEEVDIDKIKEEAKKEAMDEFMNKYKPNEQKGENIRLNKENEKLRKQQQLQQADTTQYIATKMEDEIFDKFFKNNKDVLPEDSFNKLKEYRKTGDEELIHNDPHLNKLNSHLQKIAQANPRNPLVDLEERLESALWLSHRDEIIKNRERQALAEQEIKNKQGEIIGEDGDKPAPQISKKKQFSDAQQKVAEAWGINL